MSDDSFAYFSNFGPVVKIAAPGVNILSTLNGTDYGVDSGTSMAAPHVAGAAALYKAENPHATPQQIMNMVLNSSSKPTTACHGGPEGYFSGDVDTLKEPLLFKEPPISYSATINVNTTTTSTPALGSITKN
jgi:subtilisin